MTTFFTESEKGSLVCVTQKFNKMINLNNPIFAKMSGQIGHELVFKNYNGKQYVSKYGKKPNKVLETAEQKANRSRFTVASEYAVECMDKPERKEYYSELAMKLNLTNAYTAAVTDYMRNAPK
jgi:hypothetical protein